MYVHLLFVDVYIYSYSFYEHVSVYFGQMRPLVVVQSMIISFRTFDPKNLLIAVCALTYALPGQAHLLRHISCLRGLVEIDWIV